MSLSLLTFVKAKPVNSFIALISSENMASAFLLILLLAFLLPSSVFARRSTKGPLSLADVLTPVFIPPNEALFALFPIQIGVAQTPIALRYAVMTSLPQFDLAAACDPVALSFFGTKDPIPKKFCSDRDSYATIRSLAIFRTIASEFPDDARSYGAFLSKNGLRIDITSTDRGKMEGWANFIAARLVQFLNNDGWNSQGDASRTDFRQRFSDSIGYRPTNPGNVSPLRRPLRWQPLTGEKDGRGDFATQVHVVPQLGSLAKPYILSPADLKAARVRGPYKKPNSRKIADSDKRNLLVMIGEVLNANSKLTRQQIAETLWWENKFVSIGLLSGFYVDTLKLAPAQAQIINTGVLIAQSEAILLAWREKLRHDLVRPTTLIRTLLRGKMIRAFKGLGEGVGRVKGEEWESLVAVQPHSEFPSATAAICEASAEFVQITLQAFLGKNVSIPPFELAIPKNFVPNLPPDISFSVKFDSLEEVSRSCGRSRILAGVHFPPAVQAGRKMVEGAGRKIFEHLNTLFSGQIPENCERCVKG